MLDSRTNPECPPVTTDELTVIPLFADDAREAVEWIAGRMHAREYAAGEIIVEEGAEARELLVILKGGLHFGTAEDGYGVSFSHTAGQASGVLPFSRVKVYRGRAWAPEPTRIAIMDSVHLRELIYRAPQAAQKMVTMMIERTREVTKVDERRGKMLALGKLSAGLAHELNNPASAAVRSSTRLGELLMVRRREAVALRGEHMSEEAQAYIETLNRQLTDCSLTPGTVDQLELADRESEIADWLEASGAPTDLASGLAEAGFTVPTLKPGARLLSRNGLEHGLRILVADHQILCLTREVEEATRRISDLVQAVKQYSYMDQAPVSDVDIHQGLDVTLRIFQHQLKHGFRVTRNYAPDVPKIRGNGSELNQVWTNLIDNAIDAMCAMPEGTRELSVRTLATPGNVLVEIGDNGPGIPPEIQGRIFDPFFTTKGVGEGTGLGLDIVHRIIRNLKGNIRVDSCPGRTVFQVSLPR